MYGFWVSGISILFALRVSLAVWFVVRGRVNSGTSLLSDIIDVACLTILAPEVDGYIGSIPGVITPPFVKSTPLAAAEVSTAAHDVCSNALNTLSAIWQ